MIIASGQPQNPGVHLHGEWDDVLTHSPWFDYKRVQANAADTRHVLKNNVGLLRFLRSEAALARLVQMSPHHYLAGVVVTYQAPHESFGHRQEVTGRWTGKDLRVSRSVLRFMGVSDGDVAKLGVNEIFRALSFGISPEQLSTADQFGIDYTLLASMNVPAEA